MSDDGAEPERAFRIRFFLLAGAVLYGDLISKGLAQAWLVPAPSWAVLPELDLRLHFINDAFSLRGLLERLAVVALFGYLISSLRLGDRLLGVGLALVLGGDLGNLYERVIFGYETAVISVHWQQWHFPIPNVASVAILCGAALALFHYLRALALYLRGRLAPLAPGTVACPASVSKWRSARRRSARAVGTTAPK